MILLVTYILAAIGVSFVCSVFEAALLSVTPSYIANLKQSNPKAADRLEKQKEDVEAPLVAILTLNTIAHTAGAAGAGAQAAKVFGDDLLGLFSAVLTLAILFFSEIIPKTLGANYWRTLAPSVSLALNWMVTLTKPLVWLSLKVTRLLGKGEQGQYIRAEMSAMADVGHQSGELDEKESNILKQLLNAREVPVTSVMTPRTVIHSVSQHMTLSDFVRQEQEVRFTRIPVHDEEREDIVGYVHRNEVMLAERSNPDKALRTLKRPILALPEGTRLMAVFEQLLKRRVQIAIVVDEYGSVLGLVTMEDIIESLLGLEIVEFSDPAADMQDVARKLWEQRLKQRGITLSDNDSA
ncbi:HlyC/CorC family transporter [Ferrimonas sediminicola]|uniref:HlyC/CorC family transporter n=1 Tax=Ferrimonas sediminicola TaxID=2569538 RepID=A0A4U1BJI7_9GAMM|nr:hemolysin family protein [Ferrimonas sediminicola]TKB51553.1 HlyC/CorC family transporter [Ferrimonas sediminicola]